MKILINEFGEAIRVKQFSQYDIEQSNAGAVTLIDTETGRYHINDSTTDGKWTPIGDRDH